MSGFEVVAGDIRSAAQQSEAAASGVKRADPSAEVGTLGSALPGSQSAAAAGRLATAWQKRFKGWHDDAEAQGTRMRSSAASYDASDYRADQQLRLMMHRTGETR